MDVFYWRRKGTEMLTFIRLVELATSSHNFISVIEFKSMYWCELDWTSNEENS